MYEEHSGNVRFFFFGTRTLQEGLFGCPVFCLEINITQYNIRF